MTEDHQKTTDSQKTVCYEDEIELINILRVIWKWKYLIIVGTLVCGAIAAMISLNMAKIYSIDMVVRPGMLSVGEEGKNVYIDSPQNIKALIESGIFNRDILSYLNDSKMDKVSKNLRFKIIILKQSDTIKIKYETDDIKQGMIIQDRLSELLLEFYSKPMQYFKNEYDLKLNLLNSETDYIKTAIQSYKRNVKNTEKRIDELMSEIEVIKNNTTNLISERNKLLLKNPKESNILSALLYSNTIQQNLELSNNYQNEINNYKHKKENELQKIKKSESEIVKKLNEIKNFKFKKDNIQNIQILQPASSSPYPVKPKKKLIVMLSSISGLLFMLFLTFFFEYLNKVRK